MGIWERGSFQPFAWRFMFRLLFVDDEAFEALMNGKAYLAVFCWYLSGTQLKLERNCFVPRYLLLMINVLVVSNCLRLSILLLSSCLYLPHDMSTSKTHVYVSLNLKYSFKSYVMLLRTVYSLDIRRKFETWKFYANFFPSSKSNQQVCDATSLGRRMNLWSTIFLHWACYSHFPSHPPTLRSVNWWKSCVLKSILRFFISTAQSAVELQSV
jgi:hypothetical protein